MLDSDRFLEGLKARESDLNRLEDQKDGQKSRCISREKLGFSSRRDHRLWHIDLV